MLSETIARMVTSYPGMKLGVRYANFRIGVLMEVDSCVYPVMYPLPVSEVDLLMAMVIPDES